jgi:hypothetical protein
MLYITMYLCAIVGANLIINEVGPSATFWVAFLFIGLDLTARDKLHDAWKHEQLVPKMAMLITSGSALTVLLNFGAWQVALASCAAFATAATADSLVYHRLLNKPQWWRVNGSNVPSALVDSLVFPLLAFGAAGWSVVGWQFLAKVGGGLIWSLILPGSPD